MNVIFKNSLVLYLLIVCASSNGKDYIPFFHKINQAEEYIKVLDFEGALNVYEKAFCENSNISYQNTHNACICAIKVCDYRAAFEYAEQLLLKGYSMNDFDKEEFAPLKKQTNSWKYFVKKSDGIIKAYQAMLDMDDRDFYYSNSLIDQSTQSCNSIAEQDTLFFRLADQVSNHIERNGFPRFFLCKDTLAFKVQTMLRHYYGLYNRIKNDKDLQADISYSNRAENRFKEIVYKALHAGLITPEIYVSIVEYHDGNPYGELAVKVDYDNEVVFPMLRARPEEIDSINALRNQIGLQPITVDSKYLEGTWYADFPFREIKNAVENCDTCYTFMDYSSVKRKTENEYRNKNIEKQGNALQGFILDNRNFIKNQYIQYTFLKNIIKSNGVNSK